MEPSRVLRAPGRRLLVGAAPCPISPPPRGSRDTVLASAGYTGPGRPPLAAHQVLRRGSSLDSSGSGAGHKGARLCVRAGQAQPPHATSLLRLEHGRCDPRPTRRGRVGKTGGGRPRGSPTSSPGHARPPAARDQQVITLQLQGERPREDQCGPTDGTAWVPSAGTAAPDRGPPADRVFTSAGRQAPRGHCPGRLGGLVVGTGVGGAGHRPRLYLFGF